MLPLAIDLFCGLGGWTEGLLAEGYRVIGFDIERHVYGSEAYPAQLVLQDVLTIHGRQFKDATLIVASPPCQEFSYMAMPWSRAKQIEREYLNGTRDTAKLTALFDACFRIQQEASEAAGHHIPLVVENVRGAQKWVGKAPHHFGSFYLWGDVPALMPITWKRGWKGSVGTVNGSGKFREQSSWDRGVKVATMGAGWYPPDHPKHVPGLAFNGHAERAIKNSGGSWFNIGSPGQKETSKNPVHEHIKRSREEDDGYERNHPAAFGWKKPRTSSHSTARKAASAHIAKIPLTLSRHIAAYYHPDAKTGHNSLQKGTPTR